MSNAKHTAGPWHQDGHNLSSVIRCTVPRGHPDAKHTCGDYETIARCEGDNWSANARLIASAPDLVDAAKLVIRESKMIAMTMRRRSIFDALEAAIARAEGR
jgi:hypothetical protein